MQERKLLLRALDNNIHPCFASADEGINTVKGVEAEKDEREYKLRLLPQGTLRAARRACNGYVVFFAVVILAAAWILYLD